MKLFNKIAGVFLGLSMAAGIGLGIINGNAKAIKVEAAETETTTYIFTSKAWADSTSSWTSKKDGGQLTTGQGVQVTTTYSGAGAESKNSYLNITSITFTYCTNSSKGIGDISVTIGSNPTTTYSITKTGGTTARTTTQTYTTPQSGKVSFIVNCTQNSIYIADVSITYESGDTPVDPPIPVESNYFQILPTDGEAITSADFSINKLPILVEVSSSTLAEEIRVFKNQTISISGIDFKKIVFTCTANGTAKYGPGSFGAGAPNGYTFEASGKTGTWTGSSNSLTFTATDNQVRITEIAIYITANGFLSMFNSKLTCVENPGTHSFAEGYNWTIFKNVYNSLDSEEKELVEEDAATMARYDYIVGKYGTDVYEDFIGRNPAQIGRSNLVNIAFGSINGTNAVAIIIVATATILSLGLFFFLRKKKEN